RAYQPVIEVVGLLTLGDQIAQAPITPAREGAPRGGLQGRGKIGRQPIPREPSGRRLLLGLDRELRVAQESRGLMQELRSHLEAEQRLATTVSALAAILAPRVVKGCAQESHQAALLGHVGL